MLSFKKLISSEQTCGITGGVIWLCSIHDKVENWAAWYQVYNEWTNLALVYCFSKRMPQSHSKGAEGRSCDFYLKLK